MSANQAQVPAPVGDNALQAALKNAALATEPAPAVAAAPQNDQPLRGALGPKNPVEHPVSSLILYLVLVIPCYCISCVLYI